MTRRRNFIIGLSIGTFIMTIAFGSALYLFKQFALNAASVFLDFSDNSCDPRTPANTEDIGQFKFPPSTTNLSSYCWGMQGWWGNAQFDMAPSDLNYFVSHLQIKPPLSNNRLPAENERIVEDVVLATKASTLKSFLYGSYRIFYKSSSFAQEVVIDTSDPGRFVVYLSFAGG